MPGSASQRVALEFDASEQFALDKIGADLRARGWADFVTVPHLLKEWRDFASNVSDYPLTVDDYTNDLTSRDGLEIVLAKCPEPLCARLKQAIGEADATFREGTIEDAAHALEAHFQIGHEWWWKRTPRSGRLADDLATPSR